MSDTKLQTVEMEDITVIMKEYAVELAGMKTLEVSIITDKDSFRTASDILGRAKFLFKSLDERRTELKAPSLEESKRIDRTFKPTLDMLKEVQKKFEKGMNDYGLEEARKKEAAERARREEEQRKAEEEKQRLFKIAQEEEEAARIAAENGDEQAKIQSDCMASITLNQAIAVEEDIEKLENKPVNAVTRTWGESGSMSTGKEWAFEVEDESKVDRIYCVVEESLIRKAVKSGVREIAGVRIYEKAKFTNR